MNGILIIAITALAAANAAAQANAPSKKDFDKNPFDASITKLESGYRGHNCYAAATAVKRLNLKKDEFESTEKYKDRIAGLASERLVGGTSLDSTLAFRRNGKLRPDIKYDADSETLTVEIGIRQSSAFAGDGALKVYNWESVEISESRPRYYKASNAFGATVRVEELRFKTCAIAFANQGFDRTRSIFIATKGVTPEQARRAKTNSDIYYAGKLTSPFLGHVSDPSPATISDPVDVNWEGPALVFNLQQVIVADRGTGEIFATKEISE
ncbi:hypothetical protein GCM10027082_24240 [Comamonas humi]